jgi:lipopolysaccharide transport system ATP-binding protein
MSEVAIRVVGLGKRYRYGQRHSFHTLRDLLSGALRAPFRRAARGPQPDDIGGDYFWALRNVEFELRRGQVLGVIGRNGAGKSTLLKILSRITAPTEGYAELHGRIGSLLEVGTGFNPELTGRENIFLNGAILGMKRAEISRKFDEIVAFAEVEKFIDTPVKRYSSGMYMRLAFAVAAHLEPDILIVDEVLAVGDAAFQKKCLGKIGDVAKAGRTVLFVSHNLLAVQSLCDSAMWLHEGQVVEAGPVGRVIASYMQTSFAPVTERLWHDPETAPGNDQVRIHRACVRPLVGGPDERITVRTPFVVEFEYWNLVPGAYLNLGLRLYNAQEILVFDAGPIDEPVWQGRPYPRGLFRDACHVPGDLLNEGTYRIALHVAKDQANVIFQDSSILVFDIEDSMEKRGAWFGAWEGAVRPILDWRTELVQEDDVPRELRSVTRV